jgi:hypothetical protein
MAKLLGIRQDIEMEQDEDGVFVPSRRVWVTTPDGRLCDGSGPTIILDDPDEPSDLEAPDMVRWYTDFDIAEDGVRQLVAMCPDQVELLAEAARRLVEDQDG